MSITVHVRGIERTKRRLKKVRKVTAKSQRKRLIKPAAKILMHSFRKTAPISTRSHFYKRKNGQRVEVKSGNLRKSYKTFAGFRRSWHVFVGPNFLAQAPNPMGGSIRTASGYYAKMVNVKGKSRKYSQNIVRRNRNKVAIELKKQVVQAIRQAWN